MKELHKAKKVCSEHASTELEISRLTLSAYEQGKSFPDMLILSRIADYYNVSVDYLMSRSDEKKRSASLSWSVIFLICACRKRT